jgi:hypothetical protein
MWSVSRLAWWGADKGTFTAAQKKAMAAGTALNTGVACTESVEEVPALVRRGIDNLSLLPVFDCVTRAVARMKSRQSMRAGVAGVVPEGPSRAAGGPCGASEGEFVCAMLRGRGIELQVESVEEVPALVRRGIDNLSLLPVVDCVTRAVARMKSLQSMRAGVAVVWCRREGPSRAAGAV